MRPEQWCPAWPSLWSLTPASRTPRSSSRRPKRRRLQGSSGALGLPDLLSANRLQIRVLKGFHVEKLEEHTSGRGYIAEWSSMLSWGAELSLSHPSI